MTTPEEIAIVGGSAAGFFAAARLAAAGRGVTVLERAPSLGPAPRTLIVTGRMLDLAGEMGRGCIIDEVTRFELYANGMAASVQLERPDLVIERATLIRDLAAAAESSGTEVLFDRRFIGLRPNGRGLVVESVDAAGIRHDLEAATLVGADGARSKVAQLAGWPKQRSVSLLQAVVALPPGLPPHTTRIWFRPQDTPYFYWLIPEGDGRGVLGVIAEDPAGIRARLDAFAQEQSLAPLEYQAAVIPAYQGWKGIHRRVGDGDVFLVGDAAGQVKVSTVGGVVTGFRGAIAVTDTLLRHRSRQLRSLKRELNTHLLIRRALHRFDEEDYSYVIGQLDAHALRSLASSNRDEAVKALARFARARPRVIVRAVRALLSGR